MDPEGRPLVTDVPQRNSIVFEIQPRNWVVTAADVESNLKASDFYLIDARGPDRFRGENETLDPVGGHIPGARNRFFRDNLDAQGGFRSAAELRQAFLAVLAGAEPSQVVMYCGSGVTACHNLPGHGDRWAAGSAAVCRLLGEWCSDPARPVAR